MYFFNSNKRYYTTKMKILDINMDDYIRKNGNTRRVYYTAKYLLLKRY